MNESIKNMIERRSVRGYKPDMIPKEDLDLILEAGTYAATGMGMQSPVIVAVTDKATRDCRAGRFRLQSSACRRFEQNRSFHLLPGRQPGGELSLKEAIAVFCWSLLFFG